MKIQVLGSGCQTCKKLNEIVTQAVKEMGLDIEVEYLTGGEGITRIAELGAMSSPVLAVNDQVAMVGFTSDVKKVRDVLKKFVN